MKKKFFITCFFISIWLIFTSCSTPNTLKEPTYTVWTDFGTYSDFQSTFNTTLEDGYYLIFEFTSEQWSELSVSSTVEGRHSWTKSQIKDWLIGRGFGETESTKEVAWLTTINHGFIASRTNNTVYLILK